MAHFERTKVGKSLTRSKDKVGNIIIAIADRLAHIEARTNMEIVGQEQGHGGEAHNCNSQPFGAY